MSLAPPAASRRLIHHRQISCQGFLREDGLIDIDGLLVDTKPEPLQLLTKSVEAGEPIHQMRVRLTVDKNRRIVDTQAFSEHSPYPTCREVETSYRKLIGLRIEPGFTREVKRLFRGVEGCTHLTELLQPMASTLFQILWADSDFAAGEPGAGAHRSSPIGGCHALRTDGHIVQTYFPTFLKDSVS